MSANDDEWIAGHEAAHAAVAIEKGCPLRAICLKLIVGSSGRSNARTVWRPGKATVLDAATVAASGPMYDSTVAVQLVISPQELGSTAKFDREASDNLADGMLQKKNSQQFVDYLWMEAGKAASTLLATLRVQQAIGILKALIQSRRANGVDLIASKDLYDAVRHLYPPDKLDLTDTKEDVSGECQKL